MPQIFVDGFDSFETIPVNKEKKHYNTLYDVFPTIKNKQEIISEIEEVREFLLEKNKTNSSPDELVFLAVINRTIKYLQRAKELVRNSRFTVEYKGPEYNDRPQISDFEILPINDET
jgi:hypothetical protein